MIHDVKTHSCYYDDTSNILTVNLSNGLLSRSLNTLQALIYIHQKITKKRVKVEWHGEIWNKPDNVQSNSFELYFQQEYSDQKDILVDSDINISHYNIDYDNIPHEKIKTIINTYFSPTKEVIDRADFFIKKYNIDFEKTIGILFRMTDKIAEFPIVSVGSYVGALSLLQKQIKSDFDVLIQTDQTQLFSFLHNRINTLNKCQKYKYCPIQIKELPTTAILEVMHNIRDKKISNYELGINFLASILILSRCKYVLHDTSSPSCWINIFRGSSNKTCQFIPSIITKNRL